MNETLRIVKFLIYERNLGPRIVGIHVHDLTMITEYPSSILYLAVVTSLLA